MFAQIHSQLAELGEEYKRIAATVEQLRKLDEVIAAHQSHLSLLRSNLGSQMRSVEGLEADNLI